MITSVAMTTYNGSKYVESLMNSLYNQDTQPDEVIIVDDCSTDSTVPIIEDFIRSKNLSNWHVYRNGVNLGWRANFREALKRCKGDLVFLCDQDDIWKPYKISEMKGIFEKESKIQLMITNYAVLNTGSEEVINIDGLNIDDGSIEHRPFCESALSVMRPGCTFGVRKQIVDRLWEKDMITSAHDAMLWGYAAIEDGLYLYNRITIEFRRHDGNASTPTHSLCRTRRIEEINRNIEFESFFLEICRDRGLTDKERIIDSQLNFNIKRREILENKNIFKMILFQVKNHKKYPTFRNMLSDDYVLVFRRN